METNTRTAQDNDITLYSIDELSTMESILRGNSTSYVPFKLHEITNEINRRSNGGSLAPAPAPVMKSVTINNSKGLVTLLTKKAIKCEVLQDGWKLRIYYTDAENLLEIGKAIGANLPDLVPANS